MTITTTLIAIRKHRPCKDGWEKLLANLGKTKADNDPLEMAGILESNGIEDALWCLRSLGPEHHKLVVSLACDFAERALRYVPAGETRPAECLRITRLWIEDGATLEEVWRAANAASASSATYAAPNAANAAYATAYAAYAAYAYAAYYAAADAAADDAYAAERVWQAERFVEVMNIEGSI